MSGMLISVIDDDQAARQAIVGLVRALGYLAAGFQSAAEFLQSHDLSRTACLISDMRMPGMTGLELHRFLAASGTPIPTILVTAYPDGTIRRQAMQAGVLCCLTKPCSPDDLLDCIRSALSQRDTQ